MQINTPFEHDLTVPLDISSNSVQTSTYIFWINLLDASGERTNQLFLERIWDNRTRYEFRDCVDRIFTESILDLNHPSKWIIMRSNSTLSVYVKLRSNDDPLRIIYIDLEQHESSVCAEKLSRQRQISFPNTDMYSSYYRAKSRGNQFKLYPY